MNTQQHGKPYDMRRPARELWGVATRDPATPGVGSRSAQVRARRALKRAARAAGVPLKAYIRKQAAK